MLQVLLAEEVINPKASSMTAAAVSLVLITTLGGNALQRLNITYWYVLRTCPPSSARDLLRASHHAPRAH